MATLYEDYPHGITCIDTHYLRPGVAACYLLVQSGKAVLIDTGPALAVPILLNVLEKKGLLPEDVLAIIVTHVHLDHGGGAGELMRCLPQAKLLVHPLGMRHLLDPGKLQASAESVYGKKRFEDILGGIIPADPERTMMTEENQTFLLQGRALTILHTPGHARHHQCVWDAQSSGLYSGDAFGVSYRIFDHNQTILLFPTTTPVQFDLEISHQTVDRLAALQPQWLFLSHFGRVPFSHHLTATLHDWLDVFASLARDQHGEGDQAVLTLAKAMQELLSKRLFDQGAEISVEEVYHWLNTDCTMNAQGLLVWIKRQVSKK